MFNEFTDNEVVALALFYQGTRARIIRRDLHLNPWPVVARLRALPSDEFHLALEVLRNTQVVL